MLNRIIHLPLQNSMSFFLFGPRGTGKTTWLKTHLTDALYIDLLHSETFHQLIKNPSRLEQMIPPHYDGWIIIDEVQKAPDVLNEVHRLIEAKHYRFVLTGSSARKLREKGVNLLAGRALTYHLYPLTQHELGPQFVLETALQQGLLPMAQTNPAAIEYLESYVQTYVREEVMQEGLLRNIAIFNRFLEAASFSQGNQLNYTSIGRELGIDRKTVESYFTILEDLLIGYRILPFTKRAKRDIVTRPKFYYFDCGVYHTLRPKGPFDRPEEIAGAALETLFLQHAIAYNEYYRAKFEIFYWRTAQQPASEVDFVLYGIKGLYAFEIKHATDIQSRDLSGLKCFQSDYPSAQCFIVYGGKSTLHFGTITCLPFERCLTFLHQLMATAS